MTLVPVGPVTISPSPSCRKKVYESLLRRKASASSPRARARCNVAPSTCHNSNEHVTSGDTHAARLDPLHAPQPPSRR